MVQTQITGPKPLLTVDNALRSDVLGAIFHLEKGQETDANALISPS